jgi:antitoxin component YwqK of YwqJK toxin-antitoxin module
MGLRRLISCESCGDEVYEDTGWCEKCLAPIQTPESNRVRASAKVKWHRKYFESGGPELEIPYNMDNKIHGRAKWYYRDTKRVQLAVEGSYTNGIEQGPWIGYHKNGNIESERNMVDGKTHGMTKDYYPSSAIKSEIPYVKGNPHGYAKWYHENGNLSQEGSLKDDIKQGLWKKYQANGKIYEESSYVDGKLHGMVKEYYLNGVIKSETPYAQGKPHGQAKWYNENGEESFTPDPDNLWIVENFIYWLQNQDNKFKEMIPNDLVDYMRLRSLQERAPLLEAAKTYRDNLRAPNIHRKMVAETLHNFLTRAGEKGIKTTIITNPGGKRIEIKTDKDGKEISRGPRRHTRPRIPDIKTNTNSKSTDSTDSNNEKTGEDLPIDEPIKAVEKSPEDKDVDNVPSPISDDSVTSEEEELSYAESERRARDRRNYDAYYNWRVREATSRLGDILLDDNEESSKEIDDRPFGYPHMTASAPPEDESPPPKPEPDPSSTDSPEKDESVVPELIPTVTIALKDEDSDEAEESFEDDPKKKIV